MSRLFHVLAAICLLTAACEKRTARSGLLDFEAVLAIVPPLTGEAPNELVIVERLEARAEALDLDISVESKRAADDRISVYLHAATEAEARDQLERLCRHANLELRKVHSHNDSLLDRVESGDHFEPGYTLVPYEYTDDAGGKVTEKLLLAKRGEVDGTHVSKAWPDSSRAGVINVQLTSEGGARMRTLTEAMEKGRDRLAIILDGVVVSAPVVQDTLARNFIIQGIADPGDRDTLASQLNSPLGAQVEIESLQPYGSPAPSP